MDAFGLLAEAKIRQWEQDVKDGKTKKTSNSEELSFSSNGSLERILYTKIRRTIILAYKETGEARKKMLKEAAEMEMQLSARLERSGYNLMSTMFAQGIQEAKSRASTASQDPELLSLMLVELD
ncbi:MAG: hypothetical protein ACNI3A_18060 [Desulfovibrio sp.]|uniref:hypothetical protein n=1 Tax=Desulfovibrio sp. 7SRBS1 TaxID=3378064 RepID=UPI003B3FD72D